MFKVRRVGLPVVVLASVLLPGCQSPSPPIVSAGVPTANITTTPVADAAPVAFHLTGLVTCTGQAVVPSTVGVYDLQQPRHPLAIARDVSADGRFTVTLPDGARAVALLVVTASTPSAHFYRLVMPGETGVDLSAPLELNEVTTVASKLLGPALVPLLATKASFPVSDVAAAIRTVTTAVSHMSATNDTRIDTALADMTTGLSDEALDDLAQTVVRYGSEQRFILSAVQQSLAEAAVRMASSGTPPAWEYAGLRVAVDGDRPVVVDMIDAMQQAHTFFRNQPTLVSGGSGGGIGPGGGGGPAGDQILFQGSVN